MGDYVIKCLERDRKKALKAYGDKIVFTCLSEETDYQVLCEIYSKLHTDINNNQHAEEAKWLKNIIEKTIFSKVMGEHGFSSNGQKIT